MCLGLERRCLKPDERFARGFLAVATVNGGPASDRPDPLGDPGQVEREAFTGTCSSPGRPNDGVAVCLLPGISSDHGGRSEPDASTGIQLQICGDAHLLNFGTFATPERNQVFDLNDFDETQPGPWEWDIKRLAASLVVAARTAGLSDGDGRAAVQGCAAEYRYEMAKMAPLSAFEVWHSRLDVESIIAAAPDKPARSRAQQNAAKARQRTSLQALSKLTTVRDGRRVIVEDPPVVVRLADAQLEQARGS